MEIDASEEGCNLHLPIALLNIPTNSACSTSRYLPNVYKFFAFKQNYSHFCKYALFRSSNSLCQGDLLLDAVCSSRHNCLTYCGSCDWDICENCVRIEREQQPDIPDPIIPPTVLQEDRDGLSADGLPLALNIAESCASNNSLFVGYLRRVWLMRQKILMEFRMQSEHP